MHALRFVERVQALAFIARATMMIATMIATTIIPMGIGMATAMADATID